MSARPVPHAALPHCMYVSCRAYMVCLTRVKHPHRPGVTCTWRCGRSRPVCNIHIGCRLMQLPRPARALAYARPKMSCIPLYIVVIKQVADNIWRRAPASQYSGMRSRCWAKNSRTTIHGPKVRFFVERTRS